VAVSVRKEAPVFPFVGEDPRLHCEFRGYFQLSLALRPAGLLSPLTEPSSRNLVLQVTLYTSLQLRG